MWLHHLLNLLAAAGAIFFDCIGTTLLGRIIDLIFAAALVVAALLKTNREQGWPAMLNHWRQEYKAGIRFTLWCVLIIYAPVVVWSLGKAVYDDHQYFVDHARKQAQAITQNTHTSETTQRRLEGEISDWRAKCAGFESANGILTNQNRDQQSTINNCQTQAIKLLEPVPMHWKPLALEMPDTDPSNGAVQKSRWLMVTNKMQTPVEFSFHCSVPIVSAESKIAGSSAESTTVPMSDIGHGRWGTKVFSPAWGPDAPILIVVTISNPTHQHVECEFKLE